MKNLIKITAPENYVQKSLITWVNPEDISFVYVVNQATVIAMRGGDLIYSRQSIDEVVKLINDAYH
jgi:uncharacterized protein YlzI (FlbEa/FlbD family)